jgi:Domain of unknown function (DUF6438)
MRNHRSIALGVLASLLCASALLGADDKKAIPADFKIVAKYRPGYSDWKRWEYTITGDGRVAKEVFSLKAQEDTKQESKLSKDDLTELIAKVKEADFFALKKRYDHRVTDNPTLELTVTLDGKTHEVSVYAPRHLKEDKDVKRFLKVWSEVLRKVPSPNPKQTPDNYES